MKTKNDKRNSNQIGTYGVQKIDNLREVVHTHMDKRYLKIAELAEYLGLSRWTIYDLVAARKIPFIPLSRKALRFDRIKIDKWMEKREVKAFTNGVV
jgi:excisionase family DNA binding protein